MTALSPTAIIALIQAVTIFIGFVVVRMAMKLNGYDAVFDTDYASPASVFVRNYGLWFLLLPVCWMAITFWAERNRFGPALYRSMMVLGVLIIAAAILFFANIAMCNCWSFV